MLNGPDGSTMYDQLGDDFLSTSELLHPNVKVWLRLISARPSFYMNSDNPNVSLGIVDRSLYIRRFALKDDHHKKRVDMLVHSRVDYIYLETLEKTLNFPARRIQFIQENVFKNAPVQHNAVAMDKYTALTGSYTGSPFWYQQFNLRRIRILRSGRTILDFHVADHFHIQVTTMKALKVQEDVLSIPIDIFIDHFEQVFDLTSIHYAAEIFLPRTSWKSFEAGAKLYFFTRMP